MTPLTIDQERDREYIADANEDLRREELDTVYVRCLDEQHCNHRYSPVEPDGARCEECGGPTEVEL